MRIESKVEDGRHYARKKKKIVPTFPVISSHLTFLFFLVFHYPYTTCRTHVGRNVRHKPYNACTQKATQCAYRTVLSFLRKDSAMQDTNQAHCYEG